MFKGLTLSDTAAARFLKSIQLGLSGGEENYDHPGHFGVTAKIRSRPAIPVGPKGAQHTYRIKKHFNAVEATRPPPKCTPATNKDLP